MLCSDETVGLENFNGNTIFPFLLLKKTISRVIALMAFLIAGTIAGS
jgi:hypothetical protein